jgi:Ni,Fe-hydrogenase III large subunit
MRRLPRRSRASLRRREPGRVCARFALERERIANHLGDLGYLGNDGGFVFGLAQFSRLKEVTYCA